MQEREETSPRDAQDQMVIRNADKGECKQRRLDNPRPERDYHPLRSETFKTMRG